MGTSNDGNLSESCKQTVLWFHPSAAAGGRFLCSLTRGWGPARSRAPSICCRSAHYPVTLGLGVPARIHQTGSVLAVEIQEEKHGISIPTTEKRGLRSASAVSVHSPCMHFGPPPPDRNGRRCWKFYPNFTWEMATFLACFPACSMHSFVPRPVLLLDL